EPGKELSQAAEIRDREPHLHQNLAAKSASIRRIKPWPRLRLRESFDPVKYDEAATPLRFQPEIHRLPQALGQKSAEKPAAQTQFAPNHLRENRAPPCPRGGPPRNRFPPAARAQESRLS